MEKHVSRSPLGRLNIVTMSISLKLMYSFNAISSKNLRRLSKKSKVTNGFKIIQKDTEFRLAKTIWINNRSGRLALIDFNLFYYKVTVFMTVWLWQKDRLKLMEQSSEYRNRPTYIGSINFQQKYKAI